MRFTGQMIHIGHLQLKVLVDQVSYSNYSFTNNLFHFDKRIDGAKPVDNTNIYIPRGIWLVVDYELPRIRSLVLEGVLEFEQV